MSIQVVPDGYVRRLNPLRMLGSILRQAVRVRELRGTPYGATPVVLVALTTFFTYGQQYLVRIAAPNVAQDLNLNVAVLSGIFALLFIVDSAGSLLFGWVMDRAKRVPFLIGSTLVSGVGGLFQAGAGGTGTYVAPGVAQEIGLVAGDVPSFSLLADWYPIEHRGRAFALQSVAALAGPLLGTTAGGILISHFGWRSSFTMLAIASILSGLACFLLREPVRGYFERRAMGLDEEAARHQDPPQSFGEAWRATFSVRMVRRLFLGSVFFTIGVAPYVTYVNFILADEYGLDAAQRGLFVLPATIAAVLATLLGGGLIDVLGRHAPNSVARVPAAFQAISVLGLAGFAFTPPLWVLGLSAVLVGTGIGLSGPGLGAVYSQVIPPAVRTQGLQVISLTLVPAAIALFIFGPLVTNYGYTPVFVIASISALIGALVILSGADFFEVDRRNNLVASTALEEARRLRESGRGKLLICRGLNVAYDGTQVLFGVDFEVEQGELIAVLGTNGAGKSTLLRAVSGTQEASDGAVIFDGIDITHKPPHEVARLGVMHMPGGRGVFPDLAVEDNLRLATWMLPTEQQLPAVEDSFALFPRLRERRRSLARPLSGGEQQMLALAMAFMAKPKLLMIDELSLGLAPAAVSELLEVVREIHRRGTTVVVVEQSVTTALTLAERAVFMEKGEVKFSGPTRDLLRRPDILRAVYVKGTAAVGGTGSAVDVALAHRRRQELQLARPVLEVHDLHKAYGGIRAVDGVSLQLREGELLGIVGPNGSGKTTLFDLISGYQTPDSGQVWFDGTDVTALPAHERARLRLVRRFQDARLFPSLTVFESLLVALDQRMDVRNGALVAVQLPAARRAERRARARAERLVELLDLGAYRDKFVKELSTGLRRIVDLAFVLATEPKVLLLDEPSSGIAQAEAEALAPLLRRVRQDTGCSILLIEHDIPLIRAVADELVAMVTGRIVLRGSDEEVLNHPEVIEAFLGGSDVVAGGVR
jgi:ABC-type branched-subunit amino acid transport system ATPase component/predicted MFS family arabinose efflux permease